MVLMRRDFAKVVTFQPKTQKGLVGLSLIINLVFSVTAASIEAKSGSILNVQHQIYLKLTHEYACFAITIAGNNDVLTAAIMVIIVVVMADMPGKNGASSCPSMAAIFVRPL